MCVCCIHMDYIILPHTLHIGSTATQDAQLEES